jgi:hypothetical protein
MIEQLKLLIRLIVIVFMRWSQGTKFSPEEKSKVFQVMHFLFQDFKRDQLLLDQVETVQYNNILIK